MTNNILLVSADPSVVREVEAIANFIDYQLSVAASTEELHGVAETGAFVLVILHLSSARELAEAVSALREADSPARIYVLQLMESEQSPSLPPGVEGLIEYPIKYRKLLGTIQDAEASRPERQPQGQLEQTLVGVSPALQEIDTLCSQVAETDAIVLLLGESGTGKEVVARRIHQLSARRERPMVAVNCGAIPADLLESELFGHEKGAFTGAISSRRGRFELAEGGTLFLDEIGDMPMQMQVKLLRVLQEDTFERVGGSKSLRNTARIIAATHQDLEAKVEEGSFRLDLYYRLNVFPIDLPPLRERPEDIPALVEEFIQRLEERNQQAARLDASALQAISQHALPGNVRELENLVERLAILYPGATVGAGQLPQRYQATANSALPMSSSRELVVTGDGESERVPGLSLLPAPLASQLPEEGVNLKQHLENIERALVHDALDRTNWVVAKAAKLLGLQRTTLVEKMRKFELQRGTVTELAPVSVKKS